jgi:hypothetical protein
VIDGNLLDKIDMIFFCVMADWCREAGLAAVKALEFENKSYGQESLCDSSPNIGQSNKICILSLICISFLPVLLIPPSLLPSVLTFTI